MINKNIQKKKVLTIKCSETHYIHIKYVTPDQIQTSL